MTADQATATFAASAGMLVLAAAVFLAKVWLEHRRGRHVQRNPRGKSRYLAEWELMHSEHHTEEIMPRPPLAIGSAPVPRHVPPHRYWWRESAR
jgi:hypothetical protein